jgi:fatty acid synthase subunit beta
MGMDLYASSPVAKAIWDRADTHFLSQYGFSILDIVINNPLQRTVHFGGPKGEAIRQNYAEMLYSVRSDDGELVSKPLFPGITKDSSFHTFTSPSGLLSATQFTQPALTLMERAAFEDMNSKGMVQTGCAFAGHSLGEYAALSSIGDVLPIETLVDVVFYRGMTMQAAVKRDEVGRSDYGMCAVNPARVSRAMTESALKALQDAPIQKCGFKDFLRIWT